jgi:cytochrome c oxidase subunit 2
MGAAKMNGWLLLLSVADGSGQSPSIFDPASHPAESIRTLSILVFAIAGFIFLVVEGVLLYSLIRFRRRGAAAANPSPEPPQVYGSTPIEIAWTAAPLLIVTIMVLVTARTLWDVSPDPPKPKPDDNALFVTVVGRKWWWEYRYDQFDGRPLGFITANELHIPASDEGRPRSVYLSLNSADVYHSFWVPRLAGKTALIPGRTNSMWFQTREAGLYVGQCAEYCGTQHANMLLRVVVDTPRDFNRWLENERKPAADDPDQAAREGKAVFLSQSCVNCHRICGTTAAGSYAPDLTHLMSRATLASGMIPNDPEGKRLHDWIVDPQKIKPGCLMPAFGLSATQIDSIVNYLRTLR